MARSDLPSPELLRKALRYEPDTGKLFWRERDGKDVPCARVSWNSQYAGKPAFDVLAPDGYRKGRCLGAVTMAHRAAWAIYYGKWPEHHIDHINGVRDDNRIANLREVNRNGNARNRRCYGDLPLGIRKRKRRKPYEASMTIQENGVKRAIYIGSFETLDEAIAARKQKEKEFGFHPNHGAKPINGAGCYRRTQKSV
jgi:hypothetical protein